jgi:hypothetical protein
MRRTVERGVRAEDFERAGSVEAVGPAPKAVRVSLVLNIREGVRTDGSVGLKALAGVARREDARRAVFVSEGSETF